MDRSELLRVMTEAQNVEVRALERLRTALPLTDEPTRLLLILARGQAALARLVEQHLAEGDGK